MTSPAMRATPPRAGRSAAGICGVVPMGERAVLIQTSSTATALALYRALLRTPLPHQRAVVPAAESVLVQFLMRVGAAEIAGFAGSLAELDVSGTEQQAGDELGIDVVYDGRDLLEVADLIGLSPQAVVTAHLNSPWRVAFCGFRPGFGYLTGGDPRLRVPRRDTPRERVPGGAVALAGEFTGVYPSGSPGGWQLIGRTDALLWDAGRESPALLRPGMTVRFHAIRERIFAATRRTRGLAAANQLAAATSAPPAVSRATSAPPAVSTATSAPPAVSRATSAPPAVSRATSGELAASLSVLSPGPLCTIQDLGRPGLADIGVSPSGAADRGAATRANLVVGNFAGAAVLEITMGRAAFVVDVAAVAAVTGAPVPIEVHTPAASGVRATPAPANRPMKLSAAGTMSATEGGRTPPVEFAMNRPIPLPPGAEIRLGRPSVGVRSYLAVRGGIAVAPVLGSRSTDLLTGIGPRPLQAGDVLPIGDTRGGAPHSVAAAPIPEMIEFDILPGPQLERFPHGELDRLGATRWTVSPASNRVAIRLTRSPGDPGGAADPTRRTRAAAEMPSQGLVRGAVQVVPSGELVIFLADHPVTGGYPVIGVLTEESADLAAQVRPGQIVRVRARK